jgi:glycosyltransferase involved in cell wall biosynthesis
MEFGRNARQNGGRRRVLAIAFQFPPDTNVGAQSCDQICRHLSSYGWGVTVLTVRESDIEEPAPDVTAFPGVVERTGLLPHPILLYRGLKSRWPRNGGALSEETESDVAAETRGGDFRRWVLSMLHLPDCYTSWIPTALVAGLRAVQRDKIDCLFSSGPWWTNHLLGLCLARITRLPWVAHFRDPWTEGPWLKPISDWSVRIETRLEKLVLREADAVVCVTDPHMELLRRKHPDVDPGKFLSIPNGYDGTEWTVPSGNVENERGRNGRFTITYAGNFYAKRTPYPLFQSLRSLIDSDEIVRDHIQIDLIGRCSTAGGAGVAAMASELGLGDRVELPGFLSRKETLERVSRANLLLLLAEDWPYRIPAKTYEYLRAGKPILALTTEEALVDLLKRTGGAWVADPAKPEEIRAAVKEAYSLWRDGIDAPMPSPDLVAGFDRRILAGRLANVLESTLRSSSSGKAATWNP